MTVLSVNVGSPKQVPFDGDLIWTSIFKTPATGRLAVRSDNIEGDQQSDLTVHGGRYKAVYCYPEEHYAYWKDQLPDVTFVPGMFGENLTTRGLIEQEINIGDRLRVGSALLEVTQPRMPCFKLGIRFGRPDIVKRFWQSGRSGIYFSVLEEGALAAGDEMRYEFRAADPVTVAQVVALYKGEIQSPELAERALRAPLQGGWKKGIHQRYRA